MAVAPAQPARITAVVPTYNASAFVANAIGSIRAQTRPVHEIVVVDDASRDDSAEIAESLGARVLRVPTNRGPSHARNLAVECAEGDVVAFLDADDEWLPRHCERVVGGLDAHPEAILSAGRVVYFGADSYMPEPAPVPVDVPYDAGLVLLRRNVVAQTAVAVRTAVFRSVGGYDTSLRFAEDYELWMRLAGVGPFLHVPEVTARYRSHAGQTTYSQESLIRASWTVRDPYAERLARSGRATTEQVARTLRDALDADFRDVWHAEHREAFAVLADVAKSRPWASGVLRRWRVRERLGWSVWHSLRRAKRLIRSGPGV